MKAIVVSHRHGLLPFAWRLRSEEAEVELLIHRKRYHECWSGRLSPLQSPKNASVEDVARVLVETSMEMAGCAILTDSTYWSSQLLKGANMLFGKLDLPTTPGGPINLCLGAWWTGERWLLTHLWMEEVGLWVRGLGPAQPGAGMLVRMQQLPPALEDVLEGLSDELKSQAFRGLVQIRLELTQHGDWKRTEYKAGWPFLHTHAFLSELESFSELLLGIETQMRSQYVVVLPVSVPPWPINCNVSSEKQPIEGLVRSDYQHIFFHDLNIEGSTLRTAGTDGLIGVVRGSASLPEEARLAALRLAAKLRVREKQFRLDAGELSEALLTSMAQLHERQKARAEEAFPSATQ